MRLDSFLVTHLAVSSRNKATELIKNGHVFVNNNPQLKPSYFVKPDDNVALDEHKHYVSRAGEKLARYLDNDCSKINNKLILDVGSSTGGFTQVMLACKPKRIVCVDVGTMQLDASLRGHPAVEVHENCDIRMFEYHEAFDVVVVDVSFISLTHLLDAIHKLAKDRIITLFKPQFEVGRQIKRDKRGVVVDEVAIAQSLEAFIALAQSMGLKLLKTEISQLKGKNGNSEYFIEFIK